MAEFKLGRIKFVWKNAWNPSTTYFADDVVRFGGKTFICVIGHTSNSDFYTDFDNVPTRWNQFTDGLEWKGDWTTTTAYKVGDIVKYGGYVYVCNEPHTSQVRLEDDQAKWDLFAEGIAWQGDWTTSTIYKINDIVKYGANLYICNEAHTSSSQTTSGAGTSPETTTGLEADILKWDLFSVGIDWKSDWAVNTRYKVNDLVKYGGQIYVCNTAHTSAATETLGLEDNQNDWDYFHKGVEYKGDWVNPVRYKVNDLVKYGASVWRCDTEHTSGASFDDTNFELFVDGIEYEAEWINSTVYQVGDIVKYGGNLYLAKTINIGMNPRTTLSDWDLLNSSFKFEGEYDPVTAYKIGEVVTHGGYTYVNIADSTGTLPTNTGSWSRLNSGFRWRDEWQNTTDYLLGDVVRFNQFSYICILPHTSDDDDSTITPTDNSPEKDVNGVYWNLVSAGLEESILTAQGDLVYFGPAGIQRLPVGQEGQVLTVENGYPTWNFWGLTEKVLYVAAHGVDSDYPVYGATVDKPWRTVRYAAEQIELGYEFPNAAYLLYKNRTFIQKEIVEWVDYQIANNITPFITGFTYDKATCQRDMGLLVDAIAWDLTHTGNVRSIEAAQRYFTPLGVSYITGQEDETVAAINYGVFLIQRVLINEAPPQNYQTLNGIGAGSRIKQIIDFSKDAETRSFEICAGLTSIVTDAIIAGDLDDLPKLVTPGYTINVKTGIFEEVLPIIVPANTAVVGDELRSTKISPAAKLIATTDKAKSLAALQHLQSITDDIVTNNAIVPTSGNTAAQITTEQKAGNSGSATAVASIVANVTEIKDILENGEGAADAFVTPNPTGWGTSLTDVAYASLTNSGGDTTGFNHARAQLLANKNFIKAEITAWIAVQVAGSIAPFSSGFTYDAAACARDVGYIIDALTYDITYGGNTQTMIAAKAYYSFGAPTFGEGEKAETLAAYAYLTSLVADLIVENPVTPSAGNLLSPDTSGTAGSASSAEFASERIQDIYDVIDVDGDEDDVGYPSTTTPTTVWVSVELVEARSRLNNFRATIQTDSVTYVKREHPTLAFDEAVCSRDVGLIVDALGYDLMFGSNFASIKAGLAYRRGTASAQLVLSEQLEATKTILDFISKKSSYIAASGAVVTADLIWSDIIDYINTGTRPIIVGTNTPTTDLDILNGASILELNAGFLAAEATAYIDDTYTTSVNIADAGTDRFTCTDTSWMSVGDAVRFTGTVFGGVSSGVTYYVASIESATQFTVSESRNFNTGVVGAIFALTSDTGGMTVSWYYDESRCQNDVINYVKSIAYDLKYTGNYKGVYAGRYYLNAVTGSKLEDLYYVRNGCGLRNQSTIGLDGSSDGNLTAQQNALLPINEFGTQRPRAGAYVSLDPGWGPNDQRVWITNKSTYVQNITTFGIGATGQKIDGSLHSSGNDSIVSNDFTQVISDGIGAWVTNLGRAELVSVFSYYAHIGYLAENGGKIRATNGNNSYGDFGAVAEGIDLTETAVTAKINNRGNQASVSNAITNGTNVLLLEYFNAGSEYSTADFTIQGGGTAANALGNEFRDGGVFQVRLTDPGDSSGTGGEGYLTASNVAQAGTTTSITLAATDTAISTAYVGMSLYIVAGTGAGQYGYIDSYNAGNKLAQIYKESTGTAGWDHVVAGTAIAGSLDLTTVYEIVPRLTFTDPPFSKTLRIGLGSLQWKDVVFGNGEGNYTLAATGGSGNSVTFDVRRIQGTYQVTANNPGFNYVNGDVLTITGSNLGGATPANNLTITLTGVDPDSGGVVQFTTAGTAISQQWVAVGYDTDKAYSSPDGVTWTERTLPLSDDWQAIAYGAVNGIGTYVAVANNSINAVYSTDGISWTASTMGSENWQWIDIAYGDGKFVAIAESDSSTTQRSVSTNGGATWALGSVATGAIAITYGQGRFVIVEGNFSNSSAYSDNGTTWVVRTLPANNDSSESDWRDIAYGNNRFVAIADNDAQVAVSIDRGVNWIAAQLPVNAPWKKIAYGNGVFFAFAEGSISASSNDGINWTQRDIQATDIDILATSKDDFTAWESHTNSASKIWNAVEFGSGKYVAVAGDGSGSSAAVAYSADGETWANGSITANSEDLRSIAFGNGVWVIPETSSNDVQTSANGETFTFQSNVLTATRDWSAIAWGSSTFALIADGSNTVNLSANGTTWTAGGNLPSASEWTAITHGNGRFVAVSGRAADSTAAAYSTDAGANWSAATLPTNTRWSSITHGNGRFVAVAGNTGTTTTSAAYSTNGVSWAAATLPGAAAGWTNVTFNGSVFIATAFNTNRSAISEDGATWTEVTMASTANWIASAANASSYEFVTIGRSSTSVNKIYYRANTNYLDVFDTGILAVGDFIVVPQDSAGIEVFGGLVPETRYFIKSIVDSTRFTISETQGGATKIMTTGSGSMFATVDKVWSGVAYGNGEGNAGFLLVADNNPAALNVYAGTKTRGRPAVLENALFEIWIHEPGSNYDPASPPTMGIVDPNNTGADATHDVRVSDGVLAQPTFNNRGTNYTAAGATIEGDGFADNYQKGSFVDFFDITDIPKSGANLRIDGIDDIFYKIVNVRNLVGVTSFRAQIQVSPEIGALESPDHATPTNIRTRFSQVRLTGHDFLDIGTGNETETNYPGLPTQDPIPANETRLSGGGRVFWTSTDQDGNFRVGGLFNVEQATGTATLNADAFNLAGLNELSLGTVALGGSGATITEFSTDPFFTADSDTVIPTQRAIKAYISSQIGGGSGSLNVNTVTAGSIFIAGDTITTTTLGQININTKVNFTGGVDGYPVALNLFLQA
jgi:hypothetical protein